MNEETMVKPENRTGRTRNGWLMVKSAWRVFLLDKELTLFPLISFVVGLFVLVGGIIATVATSDINYFDSSVQGNFNNWRWLIWGLTGLGIALVSTYTTAAVVGAALERYRGGDPTVRNSIRTVRKRFGSLTMFGIFNFGVGQFLAWLQSRLPFLFGRILAFIAGAAWGIANFFSIPVIVDSKETIYPLDATKGSFGIMRKVWAEGVVSQLSYGIIFVGIVLLEALVLIPAMALSAHLLNNIAGHAMAALFGLALVFGIIMTILVSSTIDGIIKAALYYYATTGEAPEHFNKELLKQSFTAKKARKLFGKPATF